MPTYLRASIECVEHPEHIAQRALRCRDSVIEVFVEVFADCGERFGVELLVCVVAAPTERLELKRDLALSTIVATDGVTSWTIQVEQPFTPRTFTLVNAPDSVHSGEEIRLEPSPAVERIANEYVTLYTSTDYEWMYVGNGLVVDGTTIRVTMPAITAAEEARLDVSASAWFNVRRCDVPGGCNAGTLAEAEISIDVAP